MMPKECAVCKQPAVVAARITRGEQTANVYLCENCVHRVSKQVKIEIVGSAVSSLPKGTVITPPLTEQTHKQNQIPNQQVKQQPNQQGHTASAFSSQNTPQISQTQKQVYCKNCGKPIPPGTKFCPECGSKNISTPETMQLRCKSCNGVMTIQGDDRILSCPYCGSRELILESDNVTIQRIKSKTEKEIEMERIHHQERQQIREIEQQDKAESKAQAEKFKKGKLSKLSVIFFIICLLLTFYCFSTNQILLGIITLTQTVLFALTWLFGMRFIKGSSGNKHTLTAAIAFVLIIPYVYLAGNDNSSFKYTETYVWPTSGLNSILPQPKSNKGSINDSTNYFHITVHNTDEQDYVDYVDACVANGFTVDEKRTSSDFTAYNEEGYKLSTEFNKNSKSMRISLDAPEKMKEIDWSNYSLIELIPKPKSNLGKIINDSSDYFTVDIAETTESDFQEYISTCYEYGFSNKTSTTDTVFQGYNSDGFHIYVRYEGFNIMYLSISAPKEEDKTPETESVTNGEQIDNSSNSIEIPNAEEVKDSLSSFLSDVIDNAIDKANDEAAEITEVFIRPEFKDAMDSYEAFFDSYIAFMNRYQESNDPFSMLNEFTEYMNQYTETMEKLDQLEDGIANSAEAAYYLEVTNRINKKLMDSFSQ